MNLRGRDAKARSHQVQQLGHNAKPGITKLLASCIMVAGLQEMKEERAAERRTMIRIREDELREEELKQGQRKSRRDIRMKVDYVERRRNQITQIQDRVIIR